MEELIGKKKENNKITKFVLFISVLILFKIVMEQVLRPENDVFLVAVRILTFFVSLLTSGIILTFLKPESVQILIWPLCFIAVLMMIL